MSGPSELALTDDYHGIVVGLYEEGKHIIQVPATTGPELVALAVDEDLLHQWQPILDCDSSGQHNANQVGIKGLILQL